MVDVSNIICSANVNITKQQTVLGLIINIDGENRVYFTNTGLGKSRTSSNNEWVDHAREYMVRNTVQTIDFKEILINAGAKVVHKQPKKEYIDLSPENVSKETIIGLLQ